MNKQKRAVVSKQKKKQYLRAKLNKPGDTATSLPIDNNVQSAEPIPKFKQDKEGAWHLPEGENKKSLESKLTKLFGSHDADAYDYLVNQLIRSVNPNAVGHQILDTVNKAMPLLKAIAPKDELEGMLAVQMIGVHAMSMEMMSRAMLSDQTIDGVNFNVNRVTKLTRTFIAQMDALNKHRGKGQQKITVEHVTVNEGGQAVVGTVEGAKG